jgi:hypothetical protein
MILGSSKARHGYDDAEMSRLLDCDVYNAGLNGLGLLAARTIVDSRITKGTALPKLLIFDAAWMGDEDDKLVGFTPWLDSSAWLKMRLSQRDPRSFIPLSKSSLWRFGGKLIPAISNWGKPESRRGFTPLSGSLGESSIKQTNNYSSDSLPPWYTRELMELNQELNRAGSRLLVSLSPSWSPDSSAFREGVKQACHSSGIELIEIELPGDPSLHKDLRHVNGAGARIFTQTLCTQIQARGLLVPENLRTPPK